MDGTYDDALKWWFKLGKIEMAPENEIQKKIGRGQFLTEDLILRLEPTDVKIFNTFQDRFGIPMVERHPVQKFKVKTVKPTTQN